MELNAEEIIKALEVCGEYTHGTTCNSCPYMHIELADNEICSNRLSQDALALIKQLTQAHEMLSESYDALEKTKDELLAERSRLTEENERLRAEKEKYEEEHRQSYFKWKKLADETADRYEDLYQTAKKSLISDTVREMQTRLTQYIGTYTDKSFVYVSAMFKLVDQIAKELIGDE